MYVCVFAKMPKKKKKNVGSSPVRWLTGQGMEGN